LISPELLPAVAACGYKPFYSNILSDHRGVFIDFHTNQLFGNTIIPLAPQQLRDISTKRVHQVAPYIKYKYQHLLDHNWFNKIKELRLSHERGQPDHEAAEKLYQRLVSASQWAGSMLKTYPSAPYSPEIARMRNITRYLKLAISQFSSQYDLSDALEDTKSKLGSLGFALPRTAQECRSALTRHNQEFKAVLKEEHETRKMRKQHLEKLVKQYTAAGNQKEAKIIKQIKRAEDISQVYTKLRTIRNLSHGGLSHVLVPANPNDSPQTCQEWKRLDNQEEMVSVLEERNHNHFGQSKNCKLTSPPLDFTMSFEGTCPKAEALLNGNFITTPPTHEDDEDGSLGQEEDGSPDLAFRDYDSEDDDSTYEEEEEDGPPVPELRGYDSEDDSDDDVTCEADKDTENTSWDYDYEEEWEQQGHEDCGTIMEDPWVQDHYLMEDQIDEVTKSFLEAL